jgi:hypothetical protein
MPPDIRTRTIATLIAIGCVLGPAAPVSAHGGHGGHGGSGGFVHHHHGVHQSHSAGYLAGLSSSSRNAPPPPVILKPDDLLEARVHRYFDRLLHRPARW